LIRPLHHDFAVDPRRLVNSLSIHDPHRATAHGHPVGTHADRERIIDTGTCDCRMLSHPVTPKRGNPRRFRAVADLLPHSGRAREESSKSRQLDRRVVNV
jgi:hypothetical protein